MKYAQLFNTKQTPQSQPIPGSNQVRNSAGGHVWALDCWGMLDRFLILGSEDGSYYVKAVDLTKVNVDNVLAAIKEDGARVVDRIVEISRSGRAPKNDPAIFALALVATFGDDRARTLALDAVPSVCRTGTHLFAFAQICDGLRGWGRGLRKAIGRWYNVKSPAELEYQLVKYGQRNGWSHRDLLRLSHPVPASDAHKSLYKWVTSAEAPEKGAPLIEAALRARTMTSPAEVASLIRESKLPREAIATEMLNETEVWEALLEDMPMTAMVRNLATMTRVGLLTRKGAATEKVIAQLQDRERLKRARVHPAALLMALRTYASGQGLRGSGTWTPVKPIVDALDAAFYTAFDFVEPTGKRYLLGVDISGSMSLPGTAGLPITAAEAATAMAMVTLSTEQSATAMAFATEFRPLKIWKRMGLEKAVKVGQAMTMGGTDCARPMLWATENRLPVDVFVVYTDNETWFGRVHPSQALAQYRDKMGIDAKLIVVGITATKFSIADPKDKGMLDVVGFDASVPTVMNAFVA